MLQIVKLKPSLCEMGRAPVTCSRADLCRTVSPWGPWSAIAFATRRATEVAFGWCGFLHSCIWHKSHCNTSQRVVMAARLRITSTLELCLWSGLLKVQLELLEHRLVLMLDIWKFIGWGCVFLVWLSGKSVAPMELTGFRSALIRSCVHQCLPIVGLPYGLHPVSFKRDGKMISGCSGFPFTHLKR